MKILVLGNSHAFNIRAAFAQIQPEFPGHALSFWGLPGGSFDKAAVGEDGVLRANDQDPISQRKNAQWNATETVDLAAFDRIFLIGMRFGLRRVMQMMRALQPLEWGRRDKAQGVSLGFLRAAVRAEINALLQGVQNRIPMDSRFVLMPAPYPATTAIAKGPLFEPVTRALAKMKTAGQLQGIFEQELAKVHASHGLGFVAQPPSTLAAPWLSDPTFLQDPAQDARHLNETYGLIAFRALAAACTAHTETPAAALAPAAQHTA